MLAANSSTPLWLCVAPLVFSGLLAVETGCSGGGGDKKDATGGATSSGIGGAHSGGTQAGGNQSSAGGSTTSSGGASTKTAGGASANATGGAKTTGGTSANATGGAKTTGGTSANATGGAKTTGGTSANATGGSSCIPASTDLPADHATDEGNTQACSSCHGTAIAGGFVFDPSGSAPASGVTVTIKPSNGSSRTAITGSKGMFRFAGDIPAPFEACLSKCPDTVCSTVTDHQNAGDCGTCHGATAPKLHLP